jgi:hypothetical protein
MTAKKIALACAALLLLGACSTMKKELGVGRNSPDEFMVVKRAPLTMPPDYDLRPPMTGSVPPASEASTQAKVALMGEAAASNTAQRQTADQTLLKKMGADRANPEIRAVISQENGYLALENRTLVDKLIFWKEEGTKGEVPASTVNARAESERLKKNQAEGKPANTGDVPVIEKKKGTIDKIF